MGERLSAQRVRERDPYAVPAVLGNARGVLGQVCPGLQVDDVDEWVGLVRRRRPGRPRRPRVDEGAGNSAYLGDLGDDGRRPVSTPRGHLPGARNVELGALADTDLPAGPVVTMCRHGERATTAASLLERAGSGHIAMLAALPEQLAKAASRRVEASA